MNKFLTFMGVFFLACILLIHWPYKALETEQIIESISQPSNKELDESELLIEKINKKNDAIHNVEMEIKLLTSVKGRSVNLRGDLYLEKEMKFRMRTNSILGKESDIGSNESIFWFWSKRHRPPALHYAKHEDLYNTRLKTPFDPKWMIESMGVNHIYIKGGIFKSGNNYVLVEKRISPTREIVTKMTVIDPFKECITAHYLFDSSENMVASTEVKEFWDTSYGFIPRKWLVVWHQENVRTLFEGYVKKINTNIDSSIWSPPEIKNKINMGVD